MHLQTIQQMFNTRGGAAQKGRCEVCNEVLSLDECKVCQDCEYQRMLEEETN